MIHTNTTQKAVRATNSNGLHTHTNGADFRTDGATEQAPSGKAIATQLAQLAIAGHVVHKGPCGDYTVCKYGMTRYCQDFEALQDFDRQLGVKQ